MLGENLKYQLLFIFELQQNNNIDVFPFFRNFFFWYFFTIFKSTGNVLLSIPQMYKQNLVFYQKLPARMKIDTFFLV